jgi:YHS domain-containing protein
MKFLIVRLLLPLLLFLILRSVLRGLFSQGTTAPQRAQEAPTRVPEGGELRKDPVCGTYVSVSAGVREKVRGETVYFCSTDCRDRFKGASAVGRG